MQEMRHDGTEKLTDHATPEDFLGAFGREHNRTVALHKPGSLITQPGGDQYLVDDSGAWRRIKDIKGREALDLLMCAHKREKDELRAQLSVWETRARSAEALAGIGG